MILAIDVDYRENNHAVIAGVMFENWNDKEASETFVTSLNDVQVPCCNE